MNIITTKDTSRSGNDCYIYESVSLVEQFGIYAIIVCQKITGWAEDENIFIEHTTSDKSSAMKYYKDFVDLRIY